MRTANPLWGPEWPSVRARWPLDPERAHLNHGSFGAVLAGVTARTRLAVIDQIASPTGLRFPVERLVEELRSRGVLSLVDGAHAPGMVDVDLATVNPDFWTGNFQVVLRAARLGRPL